MMNDWEDKLTAILYRVLCPDPVELGEYHLGVLDNDRRTRIKNHLDECPHCMAEVRTLQGFMEDVSRELELGLSDQVRVWIAERMPNLSGGGTLTPAFGLRGDEQSGPLFYQAGEAQLTLEIQDDPNQPDRKSLLGLVIGVEPSELQASLFLANQLVQSSSVDELGNFGFDLLETGSYELIINAPDVEIQVANIQI